MSADDHRLGHLEADQELDWNTEALSSISASCRASWACVEAMDGPRCDRRAERMREALARAEADALTDGTHLSSQCLKYWHQLAVPEAGTRAEAWAFAKGGAERYSLDNGLLGHRLQAWSLDRTLSGALRAYLDVLFFHPFTDGNSRAARLAFHFLATRHGLEFTTLEPLFRLSIPAGNQRAYRLFQQLAVKLSTSGTLTRSPRAPG